MLKISTNFIKNYLAKIKMLSCLLAIFFIASVFLGHILTRDYPEKMKELFYENLKDIIEQAKTYSPLQLFAFIFFKNLIVALTGVLSGIIFGFIPLLIIFANGLTLGIVSYIILEQYDILVLSAGILPHGIIEIPALIFSAAGGLWLWRSIYRRVLYNEGELGKEFLLIIKFFAFVIIPMLFAAALIETFITPHVLDSIISLSYFSFVP